MTLDVAFMQLNVINNEVLSKIYPSANIIHIHCGVYNKISIMETTEENNLTAVTVCYTSDCRKQYSNNVLAEN